jgi:hypothetical protein
MEGAMVVLAPGISRRNAIETNSLESYIHVGGFPLSSTIAIRLIVTHPGRVQAAIGQHVIPAWSFTFPTTLTVHQQSIAPHPIAKS